MGEKGDGFPSPFYDGDKLIHTLRATPRVKPGSPGVAQPLPVDCGAFPSRLNTVLLLMIQSCGPARGCGLFKVTEPAGERQDSDPGRLSSCPLQHAVYNLLARMLLVAGDEKHQSFQLKPERNCLGTCHCCRWRKDGHGHIWSQSCKQCCQPSFPISCFFLAYSVLSVGFSRW